MRLAFHLQWLVSHIIYQKSWGPLGFYSSWRPFRPALTLCDLHSAAKIWKLVFEKINVKYVILKKSDFFRDSFQKICSCNIVLKFFVWNFPEIPNVSRIAYSYSSIVDNMRLWWALFRCNSISVTFSQLVTRPNCIYVQGGITLAKIVHPKAYLAFNASTLSFRILLKFLLKQI